MWNIILSIVNNPKTPTHEKTVGNLLLSQLNTAGGIHLIGGACENYIENNRYWITI